MTVRKVAATLVAVGLTLGLIGAGVSASYSDSATAAENVHVGTFDIEISSTAPNAVVVNTASPSLHTVTLPLVEIGSSVAGSQALPFAIKNIGTIPATVKVTMTTPPAPFTSLLAAPVADASINGGQTVNFAGGLQWPMLVNADLNKAATITYTASIVEGPQTVLAVAPTLVASGCALNNGGINIPAVTHATYAIAGTLVSAGSNARPLGTYQVTAAAAAGYQLSSYPAGGWSMTVAEAANCRAVTGITPKLFYWNTSGSPVAVTPAPTVSGQTITYVIPVTTASSLVGVGGLYPGSAPTIGNVLYSTTGTTVTAKVTATVSSGLAGETGKFGLVYRTNISGLSYGTIGVLPQTGANAWPVNRHNIGANSDNLPGVTWSGVTGTGSVTIVVTLAATTP